MVQPKGSGPAQKTGISGSQLSPPNKSACFSLGQYTSGERLSSSRERCFEVQSHVVAWLLPCSSCLCQATFQPHQQHHQSRALRTSSDAQSHLLPLCLSLPDWSALHFAWMSAVILNREYNFHRETLPAYLCGPELLHVLVCLPHLSVRCLRTGPWSCLSMYPVSRMQQGHDKDVINEGIHAWMNAGSLSLFSQPLFKAQIAEG